MTRSRHLLIFSLILLTVMTQTPVASARMLTGLSATPEHSRSTDLSLSHAHHHDAVAHATLAAPDTDAEQDSCGVHCMNCISHCFSVALLPLPAQSATPQGGIAPASEGHSQSRIYLLFRPPR